MRLYYKLAGEPVFISRSKVYDAYGKFIDDLVRKEDAYFVGSGKLEYVEEGFDFFLGIPTPRADAEMVEYLKTHKIDAYFPAYAARRHNNHFVLMEVAEEVKKHGFRCFCTKDYYDCKTTEFIYAIKDDGCVLFGFKEVPYEWYVYSRHYPGLTCGLVGEHGYSYPFTIEDILKQVGPNRFDIKRFQSDYYVEL